MPQAAVTSLSPGGVPSWFQKTTPLEEKGTERQANTVLLCTKIVSSKLTLESWPDPTGHQQDGGADHGAGFRASAHPPGGPPPDEALLGIK